MFLSLTLAAVSHLSTEAKHNPLAPQIELVIRATQSTTVDDVFAFSKGWARVDSRLKGTNDFRLRANSALSKSAAIAKLNGSNKFRLLTTHTILPETMVDLQSVSSIEREMRRLTSIGQEKKAEYYEAWLWWLQKRAFPYDRIDGMAYQEAVKKQKAMPSTRSRDGNRWEFTGPRNLQPAYRIYYGPPPVAGRMNAVTYSPTNSAVIFAGGAAGHLWRSDDSGTTWTAKGSSWDFPHVNCISAVSSDVIYVGIGDYHGSRGYGRGIQKSTDGGSTWTLLTNGLPLDTGITKIGIDPANANNLIATAGGPPSNFGGIYVSSDAGATWNRRQFTDNISWGDLTVSAPLNGARKWFATADGFSATRVFRSDNNGLTWDPITIPGLGAADEYRKGYSIAASKVFPDTVYLLAPGEKKIFKSVNGGINWTDISAGFPNDGTGEVNYNWSQSTYDYHLGVSSKTVGQNQVDVIYVSLIDIVQSSDGGGTWKSIGNSYTDLALTHNDQHSWAVDPANPNKMLVGNDGGVYSLVYNPNTDASTFTPLNLTLGTFMFYDLAAHPTNPDVLLGGLQDNMTGQTNGDLQNWQARLGGDGGYCAINQTTPTIQFGTIQNLDIGRTTNSWQSSTMITPSYGTDRVPFIGCIRLNEGNPNQLFAGTNYLWRWDLANGWTPRLGNQKLSTGGTISTIASYTNGSRILTGSTDGELWSSSDSGANWRRIDANPFPVRSITSISISPSSPTDILVSVSGTGTAHLWRCTNIDAQAPVWVSVNGAGATSLPDVSLNTIARDLDAPLTTWWVGSDVGVFKSIDSGATWQNATQSMGLPICEVSRLVAVPGTRFLNAGTFGRGAWRLSLNPTTNSIASLSINPTSVVGGTGSQGTVTLANNATADLSVTLSSSSASATVPAQVTVPAGSKTANFAIGTTPVQTDLSATISATVDGSTKTAALAIKAPTSLELSLTPGQIIMGRRVTLTCRVGISNPAPAGGAPVQLTASDPSNLLLPASVTIPAGQTSFSFSVSYRPVTANQMVTVTATRGATTQTASVSFVASTVLSITLSPNSVHGGTVVTATVTLSSPATGSGQLVTLGTSDSSAATVPATFIIPAGSSSGTFAITTLPVSVDKTPTIRAVTGPVGVSAQLQVKWAPIKSLTLSPNSVQGGSGTTVTGTVTLEGPAGPGGRLVKLSVNQQNVITIPATVLVPEGSTTATFNVTHKAVGSARALTITGATELISRLGNLTVNP